MLTNTQKNEYRRILRIYENLILKHPKFHLFLTSCSFTMAFSKAKHFDKVTYQQSFWSKALAHPARIIILSHLLENGTTPFHILRKKISLAKATVSQHLRILLHADLIEVEERFPHTYLLS